MTTHFVPAPWRLRLTAGWRRILRDQSAAAPEPVVCPAIEEAPPVGRDYVSDAYLPEPGQTTTALGRHHIEPEPDPLLTQTTRVIPHLAVAQQAAIADYDPPLFLRALAELDRYRALPPAAIEDDWNGLRHRDGEPDRGYTADDLKTQAEDHSGDLVRLPIEPAKEGELR